MTQLKIIRMFQIGFHVLHRRRKVYIPNITASLFHNAGKRLGMRLIGYGGSYLSAGPSHEILGVFGVSGVSTHLEEKSIVRKRISRRGKIG